VLGQQASLLERQLAQEERGVEEARARVEGSMAEQAEAKAAADDLLASKAVAQAEHRAAQEEAARLAQSSEKAQLLAAKLRVQLKAAQSCSSTKTLQRLQEQLRGAEGEAGQQEQALQEAAAEVEHLCAREAELTAEVGRLGRAVEATSNLRALAAALSSAQARRDRAATHLQEAQQEQQRSSDRLAAAEAAAAVGAAAALEDEAKLQGAAATIARFQQQQSALQGEAQQAASRLQAVRRRQYECMALVQEVQARLAATTKQLAELEGQASSAAQGSGHGRVGRQSSDQAVKALAEACAEGTFHGRLHSVVRLVPSEAKAAGTAVHAALRQCINLASCLVVANRSTALRVVHHFERHRVGLATCMILAELQQHRGHSRRQHGGHAGTHPGMRPLPECVEANPRVPGSAALVEHLLGSWWLVPDRESALAAMKRDRSGAPAAGSIRPGRHLVTPAGEVFKADGEVVGSQPQAPHLRPYLLGPHYAPVGGPADAPEGVPAEELEAEQRHLRQQVETLRGQEAEAGQHAEEALAQAEQAAAELAGLQHTQRECSRHLEAAQQLHEQLQAAGLATGADGRLKQLERAVHATRRQQTDAAAAVQAAGVDLADAEGQRSAAQQAYEAGMSCSQHGSKLLAADKELEAVRLQLRAAQERQAGAKGALAALERLRHQARIARRAAEEAEGRAERLQRRVEELGRGAGSNQQQADKLAGALEALRQRSSRVESEWRAAVRRHEAATRGCQEQRAALRQHQEQQRKLGQQLQHVRAQLAAAGPGDDDVADRSPERQAASTQRSSSDGSDPGDTRQQQRRRLVRQGSTGGSSMEEAEGSAHRSPLGAAAPRSKRRPALPCTDDEHTTAASKFGSQQVGSKKGRARRASRRARLVRGTSSGSDTEGSDFEIQAAPARGRRAAGATRAARPASTASAAWSEAAVAAALLDLEGREHELRVGSAAGRGVG
jgi:chromosome segregation ATPase